MDLAIDTVIGGRYRVEEKLGAGGMGTVYRVRHTKLGRPFAIKLLHAQLVENPKLRRRFQREAEVAATLHHHNLVGVVDVGEHEDATYIVMELADGAPLSSLLVGDPLPAERVIACVRQLCDGLQAAHEAGLIHRDFKPDNVIVEQRESETLRIIDFGIAVVRDESENRERLTTEGIVLGTPHYMAPEHASGGQVDHRIDLFALGVICFEMLTGRMPFDGDGVDVARSNIMYDPPAMSERAPGVTVHPLLEAFTRKLMARQRDQRFASAKAAREALDEIARELAAPPQRRPVTIDPESVATPISKSTLAGAAALPPLRPRRAPSTLEPLTLPAEPSRDTDTVAPVATRDRRKRRAPIIGAGIAMGALGIVVAVAVSSRKPTRLADSVPQPAEPARVVAVSPPAHESAPPVVADPVAPSHAEPVPESAPAPELAPKPEPAMPATVKPAPPKITAKPAPVKANETPTSAPTANQVADLYGVVGRALQQLQQAKGSDATIDLWPRFRHIRINDGIATPDSRRDTHEVLQRLQRDIDARRR